MGAWKELIVLADDGLLSARKKELNIAVSANLSELTAGQHLLLQFLGYMFKQYTKLGWVPI
jgi:hypothetical protein